MALSRKKISQTPKAWVVAVDMGYGHQRPAHSLHHLAEGSEIISANNYKGIPDLDRKVWQGTRRFYEFVSRFTHVPILGDIVFDIFDNIQAIPAFYPRRDLSRPTIQVRQIYHLLRKNDWGKHLITKLGKKRLPLVTTFFIIAFMAEEFEYPGEIYCIATDTDISRAWAPLKPTRTRIKYCAPNIRVVERLQEYGVPDDNIIFTGFPLPTDNIGGPKLTTIRRDLVHRLVNLDPKRRYCDRYSSLIFQYLKIRTIPAKSNHPLTVTFSVGGAGAQREIGATMLHSLRKRILDHDIRVVLVAGVHNSVSTYFRSAARKSGLGKEVGSGVQIIHADSKEKYFHLFNEAMRTTDILWTKPSELSFYTALGVPIVMAPPIGSQEVFNRKWLRTMGVAANQYQPEYAAEWLFDWVESGWFAEAAMQGFIEAPKFGSYNIEKIVSNKPEAIKKIKMALQY